MKIALVSIKSAVHSEARLNQTLAAKYQQLEDEFEVEEVTVAELPEYNFSQVDLTINFIKSGGSEQILADNLAYLPSPVYLLATELHNSLPAALEILSFLNSEGVPAKILHGSMPKVIKEIKQLAEYKRAREKIANDRIGIIGQPSDWLIGSQVDYEHAAHHWGTEFIEIELTEVYQALEKVELNKAEQIAANFKEQAVKQLDSSSEDLIAAAKIYLALKIVIKNNQLTALTVRCFDLVEKIKTTGCLALSLLNNEGIMAGCEGDVPALFSMLFAYHLTGELSFMANPAAIDSEKAEILFAHCTIATDLSQEYIIRDHFETGLGIGIQGVLAEGPVTVFKIGGAGLEQYFVAEGMILANQDSANACRTQLKVSLPQSEEYFLNDAIGNHHLIIPGHHAAKINEFLGQE